MNDPHDNEAGDRETPSLDRTLTTPAPWPPPWFGVIQAGPPGTRAEHRAAALQLIRDWTDSARLTSRERDADSLGAALVQAVLALSAPGNPGMACKCCVDNECECGGHKTGPVTRTGEILTRDGRD